MTDAVERHYERGDVLAAIRAGLIAAGKDLARLKPEDLAAVDEFHVRGRGATQELAARLHLTADDRVIDIGSGLGGPSRFLAAKYDCHVTGIDLTRDYCDAATEMARWVGLDRLVDYQQADALSLPFGEGTFDVAWTQHVAMNIADKARFYREIARVMKPGGRFAIYDVLQGPGGDVLFPVPWAREAAISFLVTPAEMRVLLGDAWFAVEVWQDVTVAGRDFFTGVVERFKAGTPPVGLHLLLGAAFPAMAANLQRSLAEGRALLAEIVCRRV